MNLRYLNTAAIYFIFFLTVYLLFLGRYLVIPLVIAVIFWYIIIRLIALYKKIPFGERHLPQWLAFTMAIISACIVLCIFFLILSHSISSIISDAPKYQQKLQEILAYFNKLITGVNFNVLVSQINFSHFFTKLALIISTSASDFIVILIYLLFLLLEYRTFSTKLRAMCSSQKQYLKMTTLFNQIGHDINSYLKIKTAINLIAAVVSFIVMLAFGIAYADFWAVVFFIVHYIPYIGPIAGILLVLLAASIQITHISTFILFAVLLTLVQFFIGNFLEPRWLGTRLNLSPIVILLSLAFWASIWGVLGMILCVPIMVILNIILAKFPKTQPIAVALSAEGKIETD
jgi:predicted PurR-regulated permease PerM